MELLFRISAASVCALLAGLLIRRTNPELAALLSITTVTVLLFLALRIAGGLGELTELLHDGFGLSDVYIRPVLKCAAASIVTKLTSDLCRDSAQTAAASAVELAGTLCALGIVMPLVLSVLRMAGGFL